MFQLYPNNTLSRDKLSEHGEIGNIHYGDVLIKYGAILSEKDSIPRIKKENEFAARAFLQQNDIIVADTAEDETVGKVVQIGDVSFPLVGGLHTIICRPQVPTAAGYLGYYMNSKEYHDQLLPHITGIKVSSVSKTSIRKTELHIPSTVEEQATITVHYIDWTDTEKNDFYVAEEVTVLRYDNRTTKRPDLVLYINGIAVAMFELKQSSVSIGEGIRQMLTNQQKENIQGFFNTMQLLMAGNEAASLSRNLDIFGCCLLLDGYVQIYERDTDTYKPVLYPAGTLLFDPDSEWMYGEGSKRNTLIHEMIHWDKDVSPFSVEDWTEMLADTSIFTAASLQIMRRIKDYGGQATCKQLAVKYGESANFYNTGSSTLAKRIAEEKGISIVELRPGEERWWPILYLGKSADKDEEGVFIWKLRDELSTALHPLFWNCTEYRLGHAPHSRKCTPLLTWSAYVSELEWNPIIVR